MRSEDNSYFAFHWGTNGDIPAPGDFDNDGKADAAVFRPSPEFGISRVCSDQQVQTVQFGIAEDKPIVEDYDGDGKDDIAIFRPSNNQWWIWRSTQGVSAVEFGSNGDKPTPADFTGDGKADVAFFDRQRDCGLFCEAKIFRILHFRGERVAIFLWSAIMTATDEPMQPFSVHQILCG